MKNYKDFEKIYIGMSDGANLILDGGIGKLEYLFFSEDGNYMAYFVDEEIEIPQHYKKVYECEMDWISMMILKKHYPFELIR